MHYTVWKHQQTMAQRNEIVPLNLEESSRPSVSGALMSSRSRLPMAPAPEMDKQFSDSDQGADEVDELISASDV